MNQTLIRIRDSLRDFAVSIPHRLRHPTWRGAAIGLAAIPLALLIYTLALIPFTPSIADLRKTKEAKPSVLMTVDGQELASFKRANREWVKLADISPNVTAALLATEDHRFYDHHGLDLMRLVSAVLHTATGNMQGGSTLTQQLARNLYPEDIGRAPTLTRKLKEAITSLKIESVYTKDEILESYLNTVPFLYNAWGIEMAARTYFDKSADQLDVLQSATLVGMLKGTSYYNPVTNPTRATQRRNTVLAQMVKHDKLPRDQFEVLKKMPLKVDFERQEEELGSAPHLSQQLRRWLIEWADKNDYNIYADGLVVRTTIDSRLQEMANAALTQQADRLQKIVDGDWRWNAGWKAKSGAARETAMAFARDTKAYKAALAAGQTDAEAIKTLFADEGFVQKLREDKTRIQAGFMALDPTNGQVRAWVGSRDFADDQYDHVSQARRQPGSTFKPFVYGAAFENGSKPGDVFTDQALEIPLGDGNFWRPGDAGGPSGMPMTLREGLTYSKNSITAQVMQVVGPTKVAELARRMGVRQSKLDEVLSLALGTSPVTLKEMVTAYGTLANDGRYIEPMLVTQVEDRNGKVLETFSAKPAETAMPVATAQTLLDVMRGVVDRGTGSSIRSRYGIRADVAGKTGTTQDNTDGWFILMQPQLVAGAWVGFNDNRITMGSRWGQGSQSALPIVGEFYRQAFKDKVIDAKRVFDAPHVTDPAPPVDPNALPVEPGIEGALGMQQIDAANAPEGSWQPAPGIRYITVPGNAPAAPPGTTAVNGVGNVVTGVPLSSLPQDPNRPVDPNAVVMSRDLQPPEPRRP